MKNIWASELIETLGTNFSEICIKMEIHICIYFLEENEFDNVVDKMVVILSWPQSS